jgi:hypothetical protein
VNADDSPTAPDAAAERFAAAVDGGVVADGTDPELARELEIVRRLAEQGTSLDPDPQTRERARQRLLAALAAQPPENGPSRAS